MRASRQAMTCCAPPRIACQPKASSVVTATTGSAAPNASPCATDTPILTPVNAPGPTLAAMPSSVPRTIPASERTASTMSRICSAWPRPTSLKTPTTPASVSTATEQASVAVSSASTFMSCGRHDCASPAKPLREELHAGRRVGDDGTWRQRLQEYLSIPLGGEPWIAEHDDSEIVEIADQAAYALFQGQHGLRQLILGKGISSAPADALEPRLEQRIVGRGERQLIDGHDRKRLTFHVDAFPKASR